MYIIHTFLYICIHIYLHWICAKIYIVYTFFVNNEIPNDYRILAIKPKDKHPNPNAVIHKPLTTRLQYTKQQRVVKSSTFCHINNPNLLLPQLNLWFNIEKYLFFFAEYKEVDYFLQTAKTWQDNFSSWTVFTHLQTHKKERVRNND